jgi:hypothetical protein
MKTRILQTVRSSCKAVAERARFVKINYDAIPAYATSLPITRTESPELDPQSHYLGKDYDTVAFFLTLDAINFGSGYFPHLKKRPGMSGYVTVAMSLKDHYQRLGPIEPDQLAQITVDECTKIFRQDPHNAPIQELMQHFARALNDLGRFLIHRFHGSFIDLIESADRSAERLVSILTAMPYFNDVSSYCGMTIPFFKRAQLAAADLSLAFVGKGPGNFRDLDELTMFADNLVPHVLKTDGILGYDPTLAIRIEKQGLIPSGSPEEIEIRACAVHTVELIKEACRQTGRTVTSMALDYLLWNRGRQSCYKSFPRHRTRTVFY